MPGAGLYGWDNTTKKWLKLVCNSEGKLIIDPSEIFENDPTDNEHGKAPDSDWAHDHAADMTKHVDNGNTHDHEGGDGGTVDHVDLNSKGTNTHANIDSHIAEGVNPHGSTLVQTVMNAFTIFTDVGNITDSNVHTIVSVMTLADTYLINACGKHEDTGNAYFGYGSWIAYTVYDVDISNLKVKILPLFTTAYTNKIEVAASGMTVTIQYAGASSGVNTLYWNKIRFR